MHTHRGDRPEVTKRRIMIQLLIVALLVAAGSAYLWTRGTADRPTVETAPEAAVEDYRQRLQENLDKGAERTRNLDPEAPNR